MSAPALSVVVAARGSADNLPAILAVLGRADADVELIVCLAGIGHAALADRPDVTVIESPADSLVPHLWRDGIERAAGERVALTTAECVPAPDWLARARRADTGRWPGIGGAIDNDPAASARNRAIHFLRYSAFAPPLPGGPVDEIAADNAVYDRRAVLAHPDLLRLGFWEPSFHARFRAAGDRLLIDPDLLVVHHGLIGARDFVRQRHAHGRAYGLDRAGGQSRVRQALLLARSPLVAPLLLARVVRRVAAKSGLRRHLPGAAGWLLVFALAWASGEARGYAAALTARRRTAIALKGETAR